MRKYIEFGGVKAVITDEVATKEEQREFIRETNEMINYKSRMK